MTSKRVSSSSGSITILTACAGIVGSVTRLTLEVAALLKAVV